MEFDWRIYTKRADFQKLGKRFSMDAVVARVIRNRGCKTEEDFEKYLYGTLEDTHDPLLMKGMDAGTDRILQKIREKKAIRVIGDYDVDGMTATYLLVSGLKKLARDPDLITWDIPDRIQDGYGLNTRLVRKAKEEQVDTILTCDNGIAAKDAVAEAKNLGMTVVVTDHHQEPEKPVPADVIIDPHQRGDTYPFPDICGAEVAYKFLQVCFEKAGRPRDPGTGLEFTGLATNCDVMPMKDENRIYVREALRRMRDTPNTGLRALLEKTGILQSGRRLTTYHLGFVIGPCMNTQGRLYSAKNVVNLFLEKDPEKASVMAEQMVAQNDLRKAMTAEAEKNLSQELTEDQQNVRVLYVPGLHESLAGIVAGHIREKCWRPVIVFTDSARDPAYLKGSGRSIEGYDMFRELTGVKDLLEQYGGHPMAAGLTIRRENLDRLRECLNSRETLTREQLVPRLMIDAAMPMRYVTPNLVEELEELEPFGPGNEEPLFAESGMRILRAEIRGKNRNVLILTVADSRGHRFRCLSFSPDEVLRQLRLWFPQEECARITRNYSPDSKVVTDLAYRPRLNEFRGQRNVEYQIIHLRRHTT